MLLINGLSTSRHISVAGLGAETPVAPNNTAGGRARNRRVDIVLMKPAITNIRDSQGAAQ